MGTSYTVRRSVEADQNRLIKSKIIIAIIIMKTIEIKEWKKNWSIKWADMTANMQDYNNPNYQDI